MLMFFIITIVKFQEKNQAENICKLVWERLCDNKSTRIKYELDEVVAKIRFVCHLFWIGRAF